ncbi:MAG: hypothetical protein GKR89_29730 [Candidatus Latescibacteria bacterium]|nr:hypothetical protein [Candidatus Latescibacterota bacterium]
MFIRLLLLFALVPLVELALLVEVGQHMGTWPTVGLVLATGAAGAALARTQGLGVWRRLRQSMGAGAFPGDELFDGVLIAGGGLLLMTPGLITDLLGFVALVPWTRSLLKNYLKGLVRRQLENGAVRAHYRVD